VLLEGDLTGDALAHLGHGLGRTHPVSDACPEALPTGLMRPLPGHAIEVPQDSGAGDVKPKLCGLLQELLVL
jgi:hypothetical protein